MQDHFFTPVEINLDDYVQSGDGYTAVSYNNKDGKTMIKLYYEFIPEHVPEMELRVAKAVYDMGIPSPEPLRIVKCGKKYGTEFQRISPKKSFARAISEDESLLEELAERFARHCLKLHSTPCSTDGLFPSAADKVRKRVADSKLLTDAEKAKVNAFIDSVPEVHTCLHGDLHIGNIITTGKEDYWIDLADFSYGHPNYDLGLFYIICNCNPDDITTRLFHIGNDKMAKVWNAFERVYFAGSGMTSEKIREMLLPFGGLVYVHFSNMDGVIADFMHAVMDPYLLQK
jgi:Predicted aminoglycoside phosphotransferase